MDFIDSLPEWGLQLIITASLIVLWSIAWLVIRRSIKKYREAQENCNASSFKSFRIQKHEILSGSDLKTVKVTLIKSLGFIISLFLLFFALASILAVYPTTRSLMNKILESFSNQVKISHFFLK